MGCVYSPDSIQLLLARSRRRNGCFEWCLGFEIIVVAVAIRLPKVHSVSPIELNYWQVEV